MADAIRRRFFVCVAMGLLLIALAKPVHAQDELTPNARVTFVALDCSAGDPDDPLTCTPMPGVAFQILHAGEVDGDSSERHVTDVDGKIAIEIVAPSWDVAVYLGESDLGVVPLEVSVQVSISPGDDVVANYLFAQPDPDRIPDGKARSYVLALDCSNGDPADTDTCVPMENVPFLSRYDGIGGMSANRGVTGPDGTFGGFLDAPATITQTYLEESDLGVVPIEPSQTVSLEPGDVVVLTFIFVTPDSSGERPESPDVAVDELPNTGTIGTAARSDLFGDLPIAILALGAVVALLAGSFSLSGHVYRNRAQDSSLLLP